MILNQKIGNTIILQSKLVLSLNIN